MKLTKFCKTFFIFIIVAIHMQSCAMPKFKKVDQRQMPDGSMAKARKNVEEGKGVSIGGMLKRGGNTSYEFSTSNPMWRATLETLDFLPLTTVDYSGGIIISDWYTDNNASQQEAIKISIRFLSNDVRSDSLKVIVHKKTCIQNQNCKTSLLPNSKIKDELHSTIIRKAALLEIEAKKKKKK